MRHLRFKQEECRDAALAIKALRAELARVTAGRDALIKRTAANAGHASAVMSATAEKARIVGAGSLTRGF